MIEPFILSLLDQLKDNESCLVDKDKLTKYVSNALEDSGLRLVIYEKKERRAENKEV